MHPALLFIPGGRLSLSELSAARLDGHVIEIGDAYIPADLVESTDVRASSVAALVRAGTAASGPTAAWIHGAGDTPPSVHHVQRATIRRVRPRLSHRLVFHDTPLAAGDVVRSGGIEVATASRTLLDLVLRVHRDPSLLVWARRLADAMPLLVAETAHAVDALDRVPGTRVAKEVLASLDVRTT